VIVKTGRGVEIHHDPAIGYEPKAKRPKRSRAAYFRDYRAKNRERINRQERERYAERTREQGLADR
jgi:hypothetical protein